MDEQRTNTAGFSPAELQKIAKIEDNLDLADSQAVLQFGGSIQLQLSSIADRILNELRAGEQEDIDEQLTALLSNVRGFSVDKISSRLLDGRISSRDRQRMEAFLLAYDIQSYSIDVASDQLKQALISLIKDITLLEKLSEKNDEYIRLLELYIKAGQKKLVSAKKVTQPTLQEKAEKSKSELDALALKDFVSSIDRFKKKLYDLKLSIVVSRQTAAQMKMVTAGSQSLAEKIESFLTGIIPLWKNQLVVIAALFKQQVTLAAQKMLFKQANEVLIKNNQHFARSTDMAEQMSKENASQLEALKNLSQELCDVIEHSLEISANSQNALQTAKQEILASLTKF